MPKTIKINNKDYTNYFTPTGLLVQYNKIRGQNSGYMLDGSYTDDVRAIKVTATGTCMPLDEEQLSQLLVEISTQYVDLYFYDPRLMGYRTAKVMPSDPSQTYRGQFVDGKQRWTGTVIQFKEV